MGLPKRPREHELETESEIALCASLPSKWIPPEFTRRDYGVDGEVEIFDSEGQTTGNKFLVQLKATDNPDLNDALAVTLKIDTCEYYRLLGQPILVCLYHAPTKKLYAKWYHHHDLYSIKKDAKTTTFRLSPEDEWQADTPQKLEQDVIAYRHVTSPRITTPIWTRVEFAEDVIHGSDKLSVLIELYRLASRTNNIIAITQQDNSPYQATILISNKTTRIQLANGVKTTFHTASGYKSIQQFAIDIMFACASIIGRSGHYNLAIEIATTFMHLSIISNDMLVVTDFANFIVLDRQPETALTITDQLITAHKLLAAEIMIAPALMLYRSLTPEHKCQVLELLIKIAAAREEEGEAEAIAGAYFNIGRHSAAIGRSRMALYYLHKAEKINNDYLNRAYYFRELGYVMSAAKRFNAAAHYYKCALDLSPNQYCSYLLVDALMYAGKYTEALAALEATPRSKEAVYPEYRLKIGILHYIIDSFKIPTQTRKPGKAQDIISGKVILEAIKNKDKDDSEIDTELLICAAAIAHDALCADAWLRCVKRFREINELDEAFKTALSAALLDKTSLDAWVQAFVLALRVGLSPHGLAHIIHAALSNHQERFIETLISFPDSGLPDGALHGFGEMASMILMASDFFRHGPFMLRMFTKDSSPPHVAPVVEAPLRE